MNRARYDVVIVGSGIGGLVCGNYLARTGKKVLVLEKNSSPGGCCSSFMYNGFFFDSGAHLIDKEMLRILQDLKIYKQQDYFQLDPPAVFFLNRKEYFFKKGRQEFLSYLKLQFPRENVDDFFLLMDKNYIDLYYKLKQSTFQDLLNLHFKDFRIKALFYSFIFSIGTLPEKISSIIGLKIIKSIIVYGAYYPKGGMQGLSNRLAESLYTHGGRIIFNNTVEKILIEKQKAYCVVSSHGEEFFADIVISNISPIQTYAKLIKPMKSTEGINKKMLKMKLADSVLAVHIALRDTMDIFSKKTSYFYADVNEYKKNIKLFFAKSPAYRPSGFICTLNGAFYKNGEASRNKSVNLMTLIYYKPKDFWDRHKETMASVMINDMEKIFPGFKKNILFKKITTPFDVESYTGNNKGSIGGWAMTPDQTGLRGFPYKGCIKNLYFTGHWTSPGTGISNAAISGSNVAKLIQR